MGLIQEHWNNVLPKDRPAAKRDYIYCSELGRSYADRLLAMNGEPVTNPFSQRTLRVFDAGRVIEFIVLRSLAMAGILNKSQQSLELPATPDTLRVTGRLDATIGGFTDWDVVRKRVQENIGQFKLGFDDEYIEGKAMALLDGMQAEMPGGWPEEMVVEVKSINSTAFWNSKGNRDAEGNFIGYPHNKLQLFAYLKMTGLRQGILFYVSKDDMTLAEVPVMRDDEELERLFWDDIRTMTRLYRGELSAAKEPSIVYNERKGKFELNWNVGRSLYLTKLYGYQDEDEFERVHHQELLDLNRALKHLSEGKVKPEDLPLIEKWNMKALVGGG